MSLKTAQKFYHIHVGHIVVCAGRMSATLDVLNAKIRNLLTTTLLIHIVHTMCFRVFTCIFLML